MIRLSGRMMALLNHLNDGSFSAAPTNVGLKTIFLAERAGLVEVDRGNPKQPLRKLTSAGKAYVRNQRE